MTSHLNTMTNIKRLQFGPKKCHKIHIGCDDSKCTKDYIDTWKMENTNGKATSILDFVDAEGENHEIEILKSDTYLGDIIQSNGKNNQNIEERRKKGNGAIKQICKLLDELCLGNYYFAVAKVLRDSLLLSTLLCNSEAWYNLTKDDISVLESVDEDLLRKILQAHSKTPKEMLYLESGSIPIRFVIMSKRLNFLWYILNENDETLIKKFFMAQLNNPVKGDWVSRVKKDLEELELSYEFTTIKAKSKSEFKRMVKIKIQEKALHYLTSIQATHSKSKHIVYSELSLQEYLKPECNLTIKEKAFTFAARTYMLDIHCNFKKGKSDLLCRKCLLDNETQEHLLSCPALSDNSILTSSNVPKYDDLFSQSIDKIETISKILLQKFNQLHQVHRSTPCAATKVPHSTHCDATIVPSRIGIK